jgi:hypothetical protein
MTVRLLVQLSDSETGKLLSERWVESIPENLLARDGVNRTCAQNVYDRRAAAACTEVYHATFGPEGRKF